MTQVHAISFAHSPKRLEAVTKAAEKAGIKVLGAYYTVGEYDIVLITEVANEEVGVAHTWRHSRSETSSPPRCGPSHPPSLKRS
jgi:uncharacterized protein with GYD domain